MLIRERAIDSWANIERAVRNFVGESLQINKMCCNLAVILCEDQKKFSLLRNFGRGVLGGCAVNLTQWSAKFVADNRCQIFYKVWVKIWDLPPHLRTVEIVRKLASL